MNIYEKLFEKYNCELDDLQIQKYTDEILVEHFAENMRKETFVDCLNCVDYTSLNSTDNEDQIYSIVQKINRFNDQFPDLPNVSAFCVFPSLVATVKEHLTENIAIASVAAGFPSAQTFIEVKIAETAMAVMEGANEIDVVMPVGKFLSGDYEEVRSEIDEIKSSCRNATLKIILETGALKTASNIKKASILAISSGTDFIKTSTGKIEVNATPFATYVMCQAIKEWYDTTGEKIGFKAAGGIVTTEDAVKHYTIVKEILGKEWLNNKLFRIGASRLVNNLLTSILGKEVKYF